MPKDEDNFIVESILCVTDLLPAEGAEYDNFIRNSPSGHYTQSRTWVKVVASSGWARPYFFLAKREARVIGAGILWQPLLVGKLPLPIAYMERGPVVDNLSDLSPVVHSVQIQARRRGILRISLMPYWSGSDAQDAEHILKKLGFRNVQSDSGRHICSLRMDLTNQSVINLDGQPLAKLRAKVSRALRAGVTSRRGTFKDMETFQQLHRCMQSRERHRILPDRWYAGLAEFIKTNDRTSAMFVCEYEERVVSAIVIICQGSIATYAIGASTRMPFRFSKMACAFVEAIRWAAEEGMTTFDLGGMPRPGDRDRRRADIAQFKSLFSGQAITFVPEMVRWA